MNKQWKGPSGRRFCCGKNSIFSRRRSVWLAVSSQKDRATFSPPTKSGKEKIAGACEMKSLGREGSILRPYAHFKRLVAYTTVICVQNAASDTQWQIGKARQSVGNVERTFAPMTPPESRSWSEGHKAGEIAGTSKRGNKIDLQKSLNRLLSVTARSSHAGGDFAIRSHGLTQWAFPQAQAPSVREKLTEIHWRPVPFTCDQWPQFWFAPISSRILSEREVSL